MALAPIQSSLGQQIVSADLSTQLLLAKATLVGGIYTMGFEECLVLTNDIWKRAFRRHPQALLFAGDSHATGASPGSR